MKKAFLLALLAALVVSAGCRGSVDGMLPSGDRTETAATRSSPTGSPSPPPSAPLTTATAAPTRTAQGNADVIHVRAVKEAGNTWTFHVTVHHPDQGWEDYADGWDVVTPAGEVLKADPGDPFTRLLLHPHVDEQPFTRSQGGIQVPNGVRELTVRAHDLVDGYGGQEVVIDLSKAGGEGFEVER